MEGAAAPRLRAERLFLSRSRDRPTDLTPPPLPSQNELLHHAHQGIRCAAGSRGRTETWRRTEITRHGTATRSSHAPRPTRGRLYSGRETGGDAGEGGVSVRSLVWVDHAVTYMLLCSAGGRVLVLVKPDGWPDVACYISSRVVSGFFPSTENASSLLPHNPTDKSSCSPLTTLTPTRGGIRRGGERGGRAGRNRSRVSFAAMNAGLLTASAGFRSGTCVVPRGPASRIRWIYRR